MLYWMIHHELPDEAHPYENNFEFGLNYLVSYWLLAAKCEIRAFRGQVMDTLQDSLNRTTRGELIVEKILEKILDAFEQTLPGSKLREARMENVVQQQKERHNEGHFLEEHRPELNHKTSFHKDYQKQEEWERE